MSLFIFSDQRNQFKSFKSLDHLNESIRGYLYKFKKHFYNQNFKDELNAVGKVFKFLYTKSINPLHVGISYWSNKKIAKELGLNVRTVRRAIKKLVAMGIIINVRTKRENGSDTTNTYVILPILSTVVDKLFKRPDPPTSPPLKSESFNQVKQESNIYRDLVEKAQKLIEIKFNDVFQQGKTVDNLSSYLNKVLKSWENQAYLREKSRQKALIKRPEIRFKEPTTMGTSIFNKDGSIYDPFPNG